MSDPLDFLPQPPWDGPPLPRGSRRRIKFARGSGGMIYGQYGKSGIEGWVEDDILHIEYIFSGGEKRGIARDMIRATLNYTGAKKVYPEGVMPGAYGFWKSMERYFEVAPGWEEEYEELQAMEKDLGG